MKRFLFVLGALLAAAAGCDKEPCASCTEDASLRHVSLSLAGCRPVTRSSGVTVEEESRVEQGVLYVFTRTGLLVGSYPSSDGRFDFYLTDETYDFVAVVNKDVLPAAPPTREALLATVTTLSENAVGHFVMAGRLDSHIIDADEKITVEVSRLVAKITCRVRTAFTGSLAGKEFVVEDLYLTNVAGENDLALSLAAPESSATWYNRMDLSEDASGRHPSTFLHEHLDRAMAACDSLGDGLCFYAYPNASADSHDRKQWGSRCTRFVVRSTLDGRRCYYPVTLPQVLPNRHYHIDLTISNYGLEHPEDPESAYAPVAAVISVEDWSDGGDSQGLF